MKSIKKHIPKLALIISLMALGTNSNAAFNFYGHNVVLSVENNTRATVTLPISEKSLHQDVARYKASLSVSDIQQLLFTQKQFNLDDVGMVLLIQKASASKSTQAISQKLIQFVLLKELMFDVKLGYSDRKLTVFGLMETSPASSVYMYYDGKKFCDLNFNHSEQNGSWYIYNSVKTLNTKPFRLQLDKTPNVNALLKKRVVIWKYQEKVYQLNVVNNLSLVEYLNDLPLMNIGKSYVQRKTSAEFNHSVLDGLRQHLTHFTPTEKANFILAFVQGAFNYQTDLEQFGHEKYNYPEETLASEFSDCEDRTMLLAYLYQNLCGFKSVALYFKQEQHICLAVAIPGKSNAHSFTYQKVDYMVCEPTGSGYKVGQTAIPLAKISEIIELI